MVSCRISFWLPIGSWSRRRRPHRVRMCWLVPPDAVIDAGNWFNSPSNRRASLLIEVTYSCDCGYRSLHPLITAVDSADSWYDAVGLLLQQLLQQLINALLTRKLSYRQDDRAMHPIYGCSENFPKSLSTPTATFADILMGFCSHRSYVGTFFMAHGYWRTVCDRSITSRVILGCDFSTFDTVVPKQNKNKHTAATTQVSALSPRIMPRIDVIKSE